MSFLLKDPEAVLDYMVDWGAEYLGSADVLINSEWSVDPDEPGGVTVLPGAFDGRTAVVKASGGIAGHVYRIVNRVELISGRFDSRSITVRVEKR
jgi:hypothetical protein